MIHQHNTNRATAYNHEEPFERAASFIKQSIYICDQNIERLTTEIKMWGEPDVTMLLGDDTCYMKRCQAESVLKEFQSEKESWAALYTKLGACQTCAGGGWLWQCIAQDESIKVKCDACGGAGKNLAAQAAVAAVKAKALADKAIAAAQQAEVAGTMKGDFITSIIRKFK